MKKIINGKVYSTDTAKRVAIYYSNYAGNDFHYYQEELYRKKTGEFFLYGSGNAASPYSERCGMNEWCGGSKIVPLSFKEAQEWAEKHLDGEEYCDIFGEPDEDAEDVLLGVRVSAAAAHKLKELSMVTGRSQNKIIEEMILDDKSAKQTVNSIFGKKPETRIERIRSMTAEELGLFLDKFNCKWVCNDICPYARGCADDPEFRGGGKRCDYCEEEIKDWLNEEIKDESDIFAY